jgi:hypothetical protein
MPTWLKTRLPKFWSSIHDQKTRFHHAAVLPDPCGSPGSDIPFEHTCQFRVVIRPDPGLSPVSSADDEIHAS